MLKFPSIAVLAAAKRRPVVLVRPDSDRATGFNVCFNVFSVDSPAEEKGKETAGTDRSHGCRR